MRLAEKVAIITGAAEGIGRSCALTFAREGAAIVVADRNVAAGEACAHEIATAGGTAIFVQTDVADAAAVEALSRTASRWSRNSPPTPTPSPAWSRR